MSERLSEEAPRRPPAMPGLDTTTAAARCAWLDSDELAARIADPDRKPSLTMVFDRSQPPTPDGSGLPVNFQTIAPGMYRCSYPAIEHFDELSLRKLKTVITLVPEDIHPSYASFLSRNGIRHHQIPILANKDPAVCSEQDTIHQVLEILLEPRNHPVLVHCNKGKHRTGCVVACFRKVCGWSTAEAVDEYVRHSTPKERDLDKLFIERYNPNVLKGKALDRNFIGGVYRPPAGESGVSLRSNQSSAYTAVTLEPAASNDDYRATYSEYAR